MSKKHPPIRIKIEPWKIPAGHQAHATGTGVHGDKRTKRNRTRSDQKRNALKDE